MSALLALANTIAVLDVTIANVSMPHIAGSFGASTSEGTWIITSYAVAEAITVPLTGWLARRFGTVRVAEDDPVVDLRIFATPNFGLSVAILCLVFGGFFANEVISPLWMQTNLGYTATYAGLASCTHAIVMTLVAVPVQKLLMPKVDNRLLISVGLLLLALSLAWKATFASNVTIGIIAMAQGSMGVGLALMVIPLMPAVLGTLAPRDVTAGAGLMNFCRTITMAFGAATAMTVWTESAARNRVALLDQMTVTNRIDIPALSAGQAPYAMDALVQEQSVMLATTHIQAL